MVIKSGLVKKVLFESHFELNSKRTLLLMSPFTINVLQDIECGEGHLWGNCEVFFTYKRLIFTRKLTDNNTYNILILT